MSSVLLATVTVSLALPQETLKLQLVSLLKVLALKETVTLLSVNVRSGEVKEPTEEPSEEPDSDVDETEVLEEASEGDDLPF